MIRPSLIILAVAATGALLRSVFAHEPSQPPPQEPGQAKARIELIVPRTTVRPGETMQVGVKFTMEPGWHIYWKNPGDAGQAPRFEWSLPGGGVSRVMRGSEWTASEPEYPVPVRWEDAGGIVGYGYTGSVIFPAELKVPPSATPGQLVEVGVVAQYLVCKEVCLSEWASAGVKLTVGAESADDEDAQVASAGKVLEEARRALPEARKEAKATAGADGQINVSVPLPGGAKNAAFFPNEPEGSVVEDLQVQVEGQELVARFRLRPLAGAKLEAGDFEAVVGYDTNQGRRGVSIRVPVPAD